MNKNKKILLVSALTLLIIFSSKLPVMAVAEQAINNISKVFVTNWPDIQKTREQNLDADGNVKIHEQKTLNVNVLNSSSTSGILKQSKLISVFQSESLAPGETKYSGFIDIDGYSKLTMFLSTPVYSFVGATGWFSISDSNLYEGTTIGLNTNGPGINQSITHDVSGPKIKIRISNSPTEATANVNLSLYLLP